MTGTSRDPDATSEITKITFHYQDSSVPPEYHRSYTIVLSPAGGHITVDSYGEVLHDEAFHLPRPAWDQVVRSVEAARLNTCAPHESSDWRGCSGGTADEFEISRAAGGVAGRVLRCGGEIVASICGDTTAVAAAIRGVVPNMTALIEPGK